MEGLVSSLVAANRVMVFSKTYCPYCVKAKSALKSVGLSEYGLLELDNHPRADEVGSGRLARLLLVSSKRGGRPSSAAATRVRSVVHSRR